MPALPVIPNVYRVALNWIKGSQHAVNVIHFGRTASTASAIAATLDANVTQNMWWNVLSTASVNRIDVTPLDGTSATYQLATTGAKWQGQATTGDAIIAAASIVSLRTTLRGRSYRGRLYLPFQAEVNQADGVITASSATAQTAWTNFLTAMGAASQPLVVASYLLQTAINVASATPESILGTQRRRQTRLR